MELDEHAIKPEMTQIKEIVLQFRQCTGKLMVRAGDICPWFEDICHLEINPGKDIIAIINLVSLEFFKDNT
jgi:hypothetical protein